MVVLPRPTQSPHTSDEAGLEIDVVDPLRTSVVCLSVSVLEGTRIQFHTGTDVISVAELDTVSDFLVVFIEVFHCLVTLGQAGLGVVVALWLTAGKHEISLCTLCTSLSLNFMCAVSPRTS